MQEEFNKELNRIIEIYDKRGNNLLYHPFNSYVIKSENEKERALIKIFSSKDFGEIKSKKVLEIGCGKGINLLLLIKLGFIPENLYGNELLESRIRNARKILPESVNFICGNALEISLDLKFDMIMQSTVFSSILNDGFKKKLAERMWKLLKPSGIIIWYDFIFNNPKNKDVKGIPFYEVKKLFPAGKIQKSKITLAPPIGRRVVKINESLYNFLNIFPFLRTHLLCSIKKND